MLDTMRAMLAALLLILATVPALADQQAWVSRSDADRAAALLQPGSTVRMFCAPCGDPTWTDSEARQVDVVYTGSDEYWEVLVNGSGIDLAYTYVEHDGRWENLALLLGLEAFDVPRFLEGPSAADPSERLAAAERELEHLEDSLAGSSPGAGRQLAQARKAWKRYVDAQVKAEAAITGSTQGAIETRLRLTRARVADLAAILAADP
jgi:hypothetical protein